MATLGTEDSGHCRKWQLWRGLNKIQCMDCLQKNWPLYRGGSCGEVAISRLVQLCNIHLTFFYMDKFAFKTSWWNWKHETYQLKRSRKDFRILFSYTYSVSLDENSLSVYWSGKHAFTLASYRNQRKQYKWKLVRFPHSPPHLFCIHISSLRK